MSRPTASPSRGNTLTDDMGQREIYDAWNRVVFVRNVTTDSLIAQYAYDALGRRMRENTKDMPEIYFSKDWQVVEEDAGGPARAQYVFSPVYVDAMILRDRDANGGVNGDGVLEERRYVQQDAGSHGLSNILDEVT